MREESIIWWELNKISFFPVQEVKENIPILMDAGRLREGLDDLVKLADYVVCAARFLQARTLFSLEWYIVRMCNIEVSMNLVFDIQKQIDFNRLPFYYTCLSVNVFFCWEHIKSLLASEEKTLYFNFVGGRWSYASIGDDVVVSTQYGERFINCGRIVNATV